MDVVNTGSAVVAGKFSTEKTSNNTENVTANKADSKTQNSLGDVVTISDQARKLLESEQSTFSPYEGTSELDNGGGTRPTEDLVPLTPQVETFNGGGTRPPESEKSSSSLKP